MSGYDNDPNSIFRASRTVKKIINKNLKKDEDAKLAQENQQMGLQPNIPKNTSSDIDKNFSLFTLNLKQVALLMSTLIDFVNSKLPQQGRLDLGTMSIKEINDLNQDITPQERELLGGAKKGKKSSVVSSSSSFDTPGWASVQSRSVRGPQIHSAPIGDSESESDSDSDSQGSYENVDFGGNPDSDPDSDPDSSDSDSDSDVSSLSESEDPLIGKIIDFNPKNKKNISADLSREIARISNSIQHLTALWDDSISPNILYLSKIKLTNFLNSNILLNFKHSLAEFKLFSVIIERDYPNLKRIFNISITEADELLVSIIRDIRRVSGINTGTVSQTYDPKSVEKTYIGAGFLHFPSPYNNYMNHSKTKYLM